MSVEVRESAELLTSVPITGRMKNEHPDAASIAAAHRQQAAPKGGGCQGPTGLRLECCDGGIAMGSIEVGRRGGTEFSALLYARKPGSDHQLKNALQGYRYTETLLSCIGSPHGPFMFWLAFDRLEKHPISQSQQSLS